MYILMLEDEPMEICENEKDIKNAVKKHCDLTDIKWVHGSIKNFINALLNGDDTGDWSLKKVTDLNEITM